MREGGTDDVLARLTQRPLTVLFLIALLAWLPGLFTLPPLDRDESRFAQASKQMLETGDFVAIRLGDEARDQKPIGIYWLQAVSTAMFDIFVPEGDKGRAIWTYRVPSFLGAFAALALTFGLVRTFAGVEAAFFSALLLGLTVLLMSEAKIAKTDAVLLATIVGTQSVILKTYLATRRGGAPPPLMQSLLGWASFAVGILVKGPVIVFVCGASVLAISLWDRDGRWLKALRPLPGLALALLLVLPWAIAIGIETEGAFYEKSLGQDFAMKLAGGQETHGAPPGYFTLLAPLTFWPASLVLLPGLVYGIQHRREPAIRYLLGWAATTWLLFELAPTKLPHYVLPAYPALAILAGLWLTARDTPLVKAERFAVVVSVLLFVVAGMALTAVLLWAPSQYGAGPALWLYAVCAVAVLAVFAAAIMMVRGRRLAAVGAAGLSALLLYAVAGYGTVPALDAFKLSPHLAEAVARYRLAVDPPVMLAGYSEPSALFLLGTKTKLMNGAEAGAAAAASGGLVAVERAEQPAFLKAVDDKHATATALQKLDGTNYSNGRHLQMILYRVAPWVR